MIDTYLGVFPPRLPQAVSIMGPELSEVPLSLFATYSDFRMAQIKTVAFLTVMARSNSLQSTMAPYKEAVCGALVRLMQTVPAVMSIRKELMIAIRNILPTPFRPVLVACWYTLFIVNIGCHDVLQSWVIE